MDIKNKGNGIKSTFELEIFNTLKKLNIEQKTFGVAVSGGSDSVSMVIAMHLLKINVLAILVNHNLRKESYDEITKTILTMKKFGISYCVKNWDGKYNKNLEAEARKNRYKLLIETCKENKIKYLCVGHHMDDQVETFLLNIARGSGLDGMCAMPKIMEINNIKIVRPMLNLSKKDCQDYLTNLNVEWCEDASNKNIKYKRNKLRYLLEQIEDRNLVSKRIISSIKLLQEVKDVIDNVINSKMDDKNIVCFNQKDNIFNINKCEFLKLKKYLKRSILTKCIIIISKREYKLRLYQVDNLLHDIEEKVCFKRTISNCIVEMQKENIKIYQK